MSRFSLILCSVLFYSLILLNSFITIDEIEETDEEPPISVESTTKTIVMWSTRYGKAHWKPGYIRKWEPNKECPERRCKFVTRQNVEHRNLAQYDAFLFYGSYVDINSFEPLPAERFPHQIYGFVSQETSLPDKLTISNNFYDFFNYTSEFESKFQSN